MDDLSLHILDIAENSIRAGATLVEIEIDERIKGNRMTVRIRDNGRGISRKELARVLDPFYTTKKNKKTGLGLSLLAQSAQEAGGDFDIGSRRGRGTDVTAIFVHDHIDRKPLGSMVDTMMVLIGAHGDAIDFIYRHRKDRRGFSADTRQVKKVLDGVSIKNPEVMKRLRAWLTDELDRIGA